MQRVRITRKTKNYRVGDVVVIDNNEAFGLIDSGVAILSKDINSDDITTKSVKQAGETHGKSTFIRPHLS
jgi:hypothetical protein